MSDDDRANECPRCQSLNVWVVSYWNELVCRDCNYGT